MIYYFWKGSKSFIKVEMEQQDRESMDFEEIVQKAVNVEAKAGLRSSAMIWDSDIYCPQGHRSFYNTASKVQTQGTSAKELRPKESRPKKAKPAKKSPRFISDQYGGVLGTRQKRQKRQEAEVPRKKGINPGHRHQRYGCRIDEKILRHHVLQLW